MTFAELAEQYIEQHAKPEKSPTAAKEDERKLRSVLIPAWCDRPAEEITRLDVTKLRIRMKKKISHITANRCVALLGKMFALAIESGVRPDNPARGVKPEPEDQGNRLKH